MFLGAPRLKTVFASRWRALWFGAAVLATAYCSVPAPDPAPDPAADSAALEASATPAPAASKAAPAKWWAPDRPGTGNR